jgi:hypothetical protein
MASSNEITVHLITGRPKKVFEPLHVDFANLRMDDPEAIHAFTKRWGPVSRGDSYYQELLREDWRGGVDISRNRPRFNTVPSSWVVRGGRVVMPLAKQYPKELRRLAPAQGFSATIRITAERIEVEPDQVWQTALLLYLRDRERGKTGICENPKCATPYILRERKTRKVCGHPDCVAYIAKLRRNKWWRLNGAEWRSQRKRQG